MRKTIPLSSILLYLNNPRLSRSESEHESLCKMVQDQQRKLILLARDIAENGMSELDLLAVFPDEKEGYYRVAEGNRRVSALKLLQHPDLIDKDYPAVAKEFAELAKKQAVDFDHIETAVFESEKDPKLVHFLQIRHLGENGGVGTVKWGVTQKARFDNRIYGKENLVIFLDSLEDKGYLSRKQINGVTPTNWQRILRPIGLACLRLSKNGQSYKILDGYENEFSIKIKLVADCLKNESVGTVYAQKQIETFFENIENEYQKSIKTKENNSVASNPFTVENSSSQNSQLSNAEQSESNNDKYEGNSTYSQKVMNSESGRAVASNITTENHHQRMPQDPYAKCKTVIPASVRIQSRNHRINQIIAELKELDVETYPNACGCLLRALIELSAKEYLEYNNKNVGYDATKIQFEDAIAQATAYMVQKKQIVAVEASAVKKETGSGGVKMLFNGYMHNTETYPSPIVIKGIFSTYSKFLKECLL